MSEQRNFDGVRGKIIPSVQYQASRKNRSTSSKMGTYSAAIDSRIAVLVFENQH